MNSQTKILLIEDDQRLGLTIKKILESRDYDVCYANNGVVGIQKAFEYAPDLILCDINMNPVDGYQVYNVLRESSLIDHVPFFFITGNSDLQDIRYGLNLGVDDYFVKPFDNNNLISSIEKRISKYRKLQEFGRQEFDTLFKLSPSGIFLFDGNLILDANPALVKMLGLGEKNLKSYSIGDILDPASFQDVKDLIFKFNEGIINSFVVNVSLISKNSQKMQAKLSVTLYEKYSGHSLMMGLISLNSNSKTDENDAYVLEIMQALKKEKIVVSESMGKKLTDIFKIHSVKVKSQINSIFSERENQVLYLSMEGLPTKIIAERLSISDRTVEKHRSSMMEKTNSNNMIEVIIYALRNNMIDI
jgi:DNA-binding NarL/FixJ family response regulator